MGDRSFSNLSLENTNINTHLRIHANTSTTVSEDNRHTHTPSYSDKVSFHKSVINLQQATTSCVHSHVDAVTLRQPYCSHRRTQTQEHQTRTEKEYRAEQQQGAAQQAAEDVAILVIISV